MTHDVVAGVIGAMEAAGMKPVEHIADRLGPDLIRFACEGDGKGKRNGWAILHFDGVPAGAFGNYRLGISEKWRAGVGEQLSPAQRRDRAAAIRAEQESRAAERIAAQDHAALAAGREWDRAGVANPLHPYLVAKGINGEGLRQRGNLLLVPMRDEAGKLWNLQRIAPEGTKRFAKGGRQQGLFCVLGEPHGVLCVGEGYATCAVVRRATGEAVAVSFSSGNMVRTATACQALYPDADIIAVADDDPHLINNPNIRKNLGVEAAYAAAAAVGGRVALPPRGVVT
ncbi:hypothetical protein EWH12_09935 [Sphingobium cupriresistens]|uniref:Toprim domain-containing protein n=2 Tax=Sphingobium cupriresistens TaxID=1132417 RepID=A0A8G1ZM69_9SPHN|nr:hypothetical protein EWH12_09935 [Sphingobium cupriresistens]